MNSLNDAYSLPYMKWNCKYQRKAFRRERRQEIGVILRRLREWKKVTIAN